MGEIYLQGSRTGKTQEVCLELGPFCSILEFFEFTRASALFSWK